MFGLSLVSAWALCTLPACGDCVDKTGPVSQCLPWNNTDPCPTDEKDIIAKLKVAHPDVDYASVPDTTSSFSDNPPECCYIANINYTDCGVEHIPGF